LLAARVAAALTAAVVTSAAFATAATRAPAGQQGRYLSVATAGMTPALFTGVPVGTWLGGRLGWRASFWLIAAAGAVAAVGLLSTAPSVPGGDPAPLRRRLAPLRGPAVLRLVTSASAPRRGRSQRWLVAFWSVFAWGLNPPLQGSIMAAAGARAAMPALALNISGLYFGTGVAGVVGGLVVATAGVRFVPVVGGAPMLASFASGRSGGGGRAHRVGQVGERPDLLHHGQPQP
jgi:predicted MFS family arabinose efflux permease